MHTRTRRFERFQLAILRGLGAVLAAIAAVGLRHTVFEGVGTVPWQIYVWPALIAGAVVATVLAPVVVRSQRTPLVGHLLRISRGVLMATIVVLALSFFVRTDSYSRGSVVIFVPLAILAVWFAETAHRALLGRIRDNDRAASWVLIVGAGDQAARLATVLSFDPACRGIVGVLEDAEDRSIEDVHVLGRTADMERVVSSEGVDLVAITSDTLSVSEVQDLIGRCLGIGVRWMVVPPLLDIVLDRIDIEVVDGLPLVSERGDRIVGHEWYLKRAFDVVVATLMILMFSPLFVVAAIAIRLSSPGSIIYRQKRVGMNGVPFTFLKFRTMVEGVETDSHQRYATDWIVGRSGSTVPSSNGSSVHKIQNDGRVTRVGRFLRATSIDELPQLWNVIRGDMSLVGPRPPIPYEVEKYTDWHRKRLAVPPGVTGPWQVGGRNRLSFDEMVLLDIDYIERWSLGLDLRILARTVPAVLSNKGS